MSDDSGNYDRRTVLKATAGAAATPLIGMAAQQQSAGSEELTKCGNDDKLSTSSNCPHNKWPDPIENNQSFNSWIDREAEIVECTVTKALAEGDTTQRSPHASNACEDENLSVGDTYKVAVFFIDMDAAGFAPWYPYKVPEYDQYRNRVLPPGYSEADTWMAIHGGDGFYTPVGPTTLYHEVGHTLGFSHCDCGVMNYEARNSMDVENDQSKYQYIDNTDIVVAQNTPWLHYRSSPTISDVQKLQIEADDGNMAQWEVEWFYNEIFQKDRETIYLTSEWYDQLNWQANTNPEWKRHTAGVWAVHTRDIMGHDYHDPSNVFCGPLAETSIGAQQYDASIDKPGRALADNNLDSCSDLHNC